MNKNEELNILNMNIVDPSFFSPVECVIALLDKRTDVSEKDKEEIKQLLRAEYS